MLCEYICFEFQHTIKSNWKFLKQLKKLKIMNKTNVVIGVLAGMAVGALLGVLFAPDKGSETRKKLSRKATDTADNLKDKFNELLDGLDEKLEAESDRVGQMYENVNHNR